MKSDLYTKFILTAIAVGLFWIAAAMTVPAAADRQVQDVNILKVSDRFIGAAVPVVQK